MKKSKYIALAAGAAFTVAPLSACGAGQSNGSESKNYEIAMVAKGFSQSFWVSVHQGADDAAAKYGATVTFNGPDNDSQVDKQADMVQNAINKSPPLRRPCKARRVPAFLCSPSTPRLKRMLMPSPPR